MDLQGSYQEKNLRTVLAAVDILKEMSGFKALSDSEAVIDAIIHTASRMDFHGRWEKLSDLPYIICDIGHNAAALKYNFAQLEEMVSEGRCSSLIVVYGIMADKDLDSILPLMPSDATFIFTAADTPRSLPAEKLLKRYQDFCKESGRSPVRAYSSETVREAVRMAIMLAQNLSEQTNRSASAAKPAPVLIYIGGSTYVVSEAVQLF
jgi:dihydrofolate synthase/folylpolyglutamate synthase